MSFRLRWRRACLARTSSSSVLVSCFAPVSRSAWHSANHGSDNLNVRAAASKWSVGNSITADRQSVLAMTGVLHNLGTALQPVQLAQATHDLVGEDHVVDLIQERARLEQPVLLIVHGFLQSAQQLACAHLSHD